MPVMKYWDLYDVRMSKESLAKVLLALIKCRGYFSDSYADRMGMESEMPWKGYVTLRICLPEGKEKDFEKCCGYKPFEKPIIG